VLFPLFEKLHWLDKTIGAIPEQLCTWSGEKVCRLPGEIIASGVSFLEKIGVKNPETSIYGLIESVAPGWTKLWLQSFEGYPVTVGILALILAWLFFLKSDQLQAQIARRAEYAWADYKRITPVPAPDPGLSDRVARFMRTYVVDVMHYFVRVIVPLFFGLFTWLLLIAVVVITFPLSLYALYKFWKFVRGGDAEATL
jgi:hypothetical protein